LFDIPTLLENLKLEELIKLLETSGLSSDVLSSRTNNFTIFAPSDEAVKMFLPLVAEMETTVDLTVTDYLRLMKLPKKSTSIIMRFAI
jgi:hypothetical protein